MTAETDRHDGADISSRGGNHALPKEMKAVPRIDRSNTEHYGVTFGGSVSTRWAEPTEYAPPAGRPTRDADPSTMDNQTVRKAGPFTRR
jgi:hypothetical protein